MKNLLQSSILHYCIVKPFSKLINGIIISYGIIRYKKLRNYLYKRISIKDTPNQLKFKKESYQYLKTQENANPCSINPITIIKTFKEAEINKNSLVIDLGSGTGEFIISASLVTKATVTGIEAIPCIHKIAERKKMFLTQEERKKIHLKCQTIENTKIEGYTHYFIAWTTWDEKTKKKIIKELESIKNQITVITTTYSICSKKFKIIKSYLTLFSWGIGTIYIHKKRN